MAYFFIHISLWKLSFFLYFSFPSFYFHFLCIFAWFSSTQHYPVLMLEITFTDESVKELNWSHFCLVILSWLLSLQLLWNQFCLFSLYTNLNRHPIFHALFRISCLFLFYFLYCSNFFVNFRIIRILEFLESLEFIEFLESLEFWDSLEFLDFLIFRTFF